MLKNLRKVDFEEEMKGKINKGDKQLYRSGKTRYDRAGKSVQEKPEKMKTGMYERKKMSALDGG